MSTILLVDDDVDSLWLLQIILVGHGYRVLIAEGGEAALDKAAQCLPDLIVTAYSTPNRTLIPRQTEHGFHSKASADSTANRIGIPRLPERDFHA